MPPRRAIHWLLMFAVVAAVQAGNAAVVQASCGDYLIGHGQRESLPVHEALPDQHGPAPASPLSKIPCDGPGCQKAPVGPTAPVPVKTSQPETHRLGCLVAALRLTPATQMLSVDDHIERPRSAELSSIEHPPRS